MTLEFPKHVVITNGRLQALYYFCMVVMSAVFVSTFFYFESHVLGIPMAGHVHVTLWPSASANIRDALQRAAEVSSVNMQKPFCQQPQDFDFWWDMDWQYVNHTCVSLCSAYSQEEDECLSLLDAFVTESSDQILLTTQIEKTFVPKLLGASLPQRRNYLVPTTEAQGIGFAYSFDLPREKVMRSSWILAPSQSFSGSSTRDVLTVMVNHEDVPFDTIKPGGNTQLTVENLLEMAGKPDLLDSFGVHVNTKPGAKYKTGPLTRISGATLALEVNCYNRPPLPDVLPLLDEPWDGPTCYVRIRHVNSDAAWPSAARRELAEDAFGRKGENHFLYHGLRVDAKGDGVFKVIDFNSIYLNTVSFMVLMTLPKAFVLFVTVSLLGHFSKIYKGAIYERFRIVEQVAGMSTRLMSNSVNFVDLKDGEVDDTVSSGGISKKRMGERLRKALEYRGETLDEEEVESFVNFCFSAVSANKKKNRLRRSWSSFFSWFTGKRQRETQKPAQKINIDMFSKACSSLDKIKFEAVVKLFDRDRRMGILERLFTPDFMRKYLSDVDHRRARSVSEFFASGGTPSKDRSTKRKKTQQSDTNRVMEELGFEATQAPRTPRLVRFEDIETGSSVSGTSHQPTMTRAPSLESAQLTQHLVKHFQNFNEMMQDDQELEHISPEQRKSLLHMMLQALQDVLTRELAIYPKLRNCQDKLEDFGAELEDSIKSTESQVYEQMTEVEKRLRGQMGNVQDESRVEHGKLKGPLENMSKELETTKATLSRCLEELAKREEDIEELKQLSARRSECSEAQDVAKTEPAGLNQQAQCDDTDQNTPGNSAQSKDPGNRVQSEHASAQQQSVQPGLPHKSRRPASGHIGECMSRKARYTFT